MVLQLLTGLPSEYSPVKKISPLPNFEKACLLVSMQERVLKLQDRHEEQNRSDPRVVVGEEESSAFITLEKVATIVGIASTIMGAAATFTTVAGAVSASRMIAVGAVSTVAAVTGWKIWQTQKKSD